MLAHNNFENPDAPTFIVGRNFFNEIKENSPNLVNNKDLDFRRTILGYIISGQIESADLSVNKAHPGSTLKIIH